MNERIEHLTAALLVLADLIELKEVYAPIFERLDAELIAEGHGENAVLNRTRLKLKKGV